MFKTLDNLHKKNSIWLRLTLAVCMLFVLQAASNENEVKKPEMDEEKEEWLKAIQGTDLPATDPSIASIAFHLKYPNEIVFVKHIKETKKKGTNTPAPDIKSLLLRENSIYSAQPVVSVPLYSWMNRALYYIGFYMFVERKPSACINIVLNYRKTDLEYDTPSIYKKAWIFDFLKKKEEEIDSGYSHILLEVLVYHLYKRELNKLDRDFGLAKEKFTSYLKDAELSMEDLEKIGLDERILKAINNDTTQESREELEAEVKNRTKKLARSVKKRDYLFWDKMFNNTYFDQFSNPIDRNEILEIFESGLYSGYISKPSNTNISFNTLKEAYMRYNPKHAIEKHRNALEKADEKWKNSIFLSSIISNDKLYLFVEYHQEESYKSKVLEFNEKNIRNIQEAETIEDIVQLSSIDDVSFVKEKIYRNLGQGINMLKSLDESLFFKS